MSPLKFWGNILIYDTAASFHIPCHSQISLGFDAAEPIQLENVVKQHNK
jgi:hypothetical protein